MAGSIQNRRIFVEDVIDKEGAIDAEKLLYVTNVFMEAVYGLFDANIEVREHLNADIIKLSFTTAGDYSTVQTFAPVSFKQTLKKRPDGLVIINMINNTNRSKLFQSAVTLDWSEDKDTIKINYVTGLDDNTAYTLTILVL